MKRLTIITILISGMMLPLISLYSQEERTIDQDVRVVREYSPTVSDALKISDMPDTSEPDVPAPEFYYRLSGNVMIGTPDVVPLIPARMAKEPLEELNTSYIRGYIGNYDILGGSLLYNLIQNETFALGLKASHESSWGQLTLEDKRDVKAPYHQTNGGLFLRHFFKQKTLSLDMDFNHHAYRYYGFQTFHGDNRYYFPAGGPTNFPGSALIPDPSQHQTTFDVDLGVLNQQISRYSTQYKLNKGFSTFANATGVKENQFRFTGDFDFPIGELSLRLESGMNHASVNHSNQSFLDLNNFSTRQQTLVYMNPAMVRQEDHYKLKMGVRIATEFDDLGDNFYLSPDVTGQLNIAEGIVSLEGGVTGEIMPSTYRSVMAENPYTAPDLHVKTAFNGVKFFLGAIANFSTMTSFAGRLEYNVLHDQHFFVNRRFSDFASGDEHFSNIFDVDYDDGNLLKVSGEFKLNFLPDLDITLRGAYYGWDLDSLQHAWHKPKTEVGLRMAFRADESLTFYGSVNVLGERYVSIPDMLDDEIHTLKPVYDFNLGASYVLNRRWNFFGELRNLGASKYYRWNGYPMHGINGRVGVGYRF